MDRWSFRDGPKGRARNPYSPSVVMDSGLAAARRPGMTGIFRAPFQSVRLIAPADRGLALAEAWQLPHTGAARVAVSADVCVDQVGAAGGDPGPHRVAEAHGTESPRADERIRPLRLAERNEPVVVHPDVAHQNTVVGQRSINLAGGALRVDGRAVVHETRSDEGLPLLAIARDGIEPFGASRRLGADALARIDFAENLAQERAHVGHQAERPRIVAADFVPGDVHVDEPRGRDRERIAGKP